MSLSESILTLAEKIKTGKHYFESQEELDDYLAYLAEVEGLDQNGISRMARELAAYGANPWQRAQQRAAHIAFFVALAVVVGVLTGSPVFPSGPMEAVFQLSFQLPMAVALSWGLFLVVYSVAQVAYLSFQYSNLSACDPFLRMVERHEAVPRLDLKDHAISSLWVFGGLSIWFSIPAFDKALGAAGYLWPLLILVPIGVVALRQRLPHRL